MSDRDIEPIRPEDIPADLVALFHRAHFGNGRDVAARAALAVVLTDVTERIAQAVEVELTEDLGDMLVVTVEGQRAAAVVRSWPEAFDA